MPGRVHTEDPSPVVGSTEAQSGRVRDDGEGVTMVINPPGAHEF